jgi:glycolate oxidase FAD binding subunit
MHVGNVPERYDVALDLTGLDRNVAHEPGDLTVVAEAGVRVAALDAHLAAAGQRLPFDVPEPEKASIGGSVASNAYGFLRSSVGGIRDWVIGMKVVLPDGTVTKSGGRVVKNVQGFDLHRLHTGAFGTLGVIAEVAFKLIPLPAHTRTVAAVFNTLDAATRAATALYNAHFTPEAVSLFYGSAAARTITSRMPPGAAGQSRILLLTRVAGGEATVARQVDGTVDFVRAAGCAAVETFEGPGAGPIWQEACEHPGGVTVATHAVFRPSAAYRALADIELAASSWPGMTLSARIDCGYGALSTNWWTDNDDSAREAVNVSIQAARLQNTVAVIERCPRGMKRGMDVFGNPGPSLAIMRRMKEQYDPSRVLNPGRFAGGI